MIRFYIDEEFLRAETPEAGTISMETIGRIIAEPKYKLTLKFEMGRSTQKAAGQYSRGSGVRGTVLPRQNLAEGEFAQANSVRRASQIKAPGGGLPALALRVKKDADVLATVEAFIDELV